MIRSIQAAHGYKGDDHSPLIPTPHMTMTYSENDNMDGGFQSDTDDDTGYFSTNSYEDTDTCVTPTVSPKQHISNDMSSFTSPSHISTSPSSPTLTPPSTTSSLTTSPRPWLATPPLPAMQPQSLIPELVLSGNTPSSSSSPSNNKGGALDHSSLVDVELGMTTPIRTDSEMSATSTSSASSNRLSHRQQDNSLPTGVLVVYVLWRLLQTAVAYIVPIRILGVAVSSYSFHHKEGEEGDVDFEYYLEGVGGRGVIITGGGCFLLGVLVMDWLFQLCLKNLHRQSLARTLRASSLMLTISLILLTCLPSHISSSTSSYGSSSLEVESTSRLLMDTSTSTDSTSSSTSTPRYIHESSLFEDVIATCGYSFFLGTISCCLIHKRAWIPSLPDVLSYESLPSWLLIIADAIGAFLGPWFFMYMLTSEASLAFILQICVFFSVSLCVASACFGA